MLRLSDQHTFAAIAREHSPDEVDLRAFALFADGTIGSVELSNVMRGAGPGQWQEAPSPTTPQLAHVVDRLMPVSALPSPPAPCMVIVRW